MVIWVGASAPATLTVICLLKVPAAAALKPAVILSSLPLPTGAWGQVGVVQPQEATALSTTSGFVAGVGELEVVSNGNTLFDLAEIVNGFRKLHQVFSFL